MTHLTKAAPITTLFDYDGLEAAHRSVVQQRTGEIRERLRRSAQDVWEIGQKLSDVRARLKYGQFLTWIKTEFGWSQRTAYNFINVYETFGDRFANLAKVNIATSLLYQLASPSVPEELREQILRAAEQGETMTAKELKATIQERRLRAAARKQKQTEDRTALPSKQSPDIKRTASGAEIITVVARAADASEPSPERSNSIQPRSVRQDQDMNLSKPSPEQTSELMIQAGWYQLEGRHLVFCGDTAA
ncbi:MAG: DUF3102 domain-containing protein, partial [Cyanobacteria bacterium P01_D01_bin.1]